MDDLCLLTPPEIAKKIGAKKTTDLTSGVKNLSASSLNNLKISMLKMKKLKSMELLKVLSD